MDFSDYWSDVVWSIEMPSFDYLEDVYIIFIQQMRYKNSHKQVERHTNQLEQTLKLLKCKEKVNYLHKFRATTDMPSIAVRTCTLQLCKWSLQLAKSEWSPHLQYLPSSSVNTKLLSGSYSICCFCIYSHHERVLKVYIYFTSHECGLTFPVKQCTWVLNECKNWFFWSAAGSCLLKRRH